MFDSTPNVEHLSLPRTPAGCAALQALGRPASAPSAERHERLFAEDSDSAVATYKQMCGFTAAYKTATLHPTDQRLQTAQISGPDPLQQPQAKELRQAATHQKPDMRGLAASATEQLPLRTSSTSCCNVPNLMTCAMPTVTSSRHQDRL